MKKKTPTCREHRARKTKNQPKEKNVRDNREGGGTRKKKKRDGMTNNRQPKGKKLRGRKTNKTKGPGLEKEKG